MITITKEKNLIRFQDTSKTKPYVLDINTMKFYGLSGKELLRNPISTSIRDTIDRMGYKDITYLQGAIKEMLWCCGSSTYKYTRYKDALAVADTLTNLKIPYYAVGLESYQKIKPHIKEFIEYVERREAGEQISLSTFLTELDYNAFLKEHNLTTDMVDIEKYKDIRNSPVIIKNLSHYVYATERAYLREFCILAYRWSGYDKRVLEQYYEECELLNKEPVKINNMVREIVETHRQYVLRKTEFDSERMANNYNKHKKAFEFTYGEYSVVVPKSPTDIIDEGNNMHHCVGGYVQQVVDNDTYIVFIRKTNTPNECYITAQIDLKGRLGQYYLAYDRRVSSAEDIAFKRAFEQHLIENWNI